MLSLATRVASPSLLMAAPWLLILPPVARMVKLPPALSELTCAVLVAWSLVLLALREPACTTTAVVAAATPSVVASAYLVLLPSMLVLGLLLALCWKALWKAASGLSVVPIEKPLELDCWALCSTTM